MTKHILLLVLLVPGVGARAVADCAPQGVVRMETATVSPGLPKDSFARKPKVLYRSGSRYARIEEAADLAAGIHGLVVVNAPHSWMVNLLDKTGRDIVDPDPEGKVHAPVLLEAQLPDGVPAQFNELELGCEAEFFTKSGAEQVPHEAGGHKLTKHVLTKGPWRFTLLTEAASTIPKALLLSREGRVVYTLQYLSYTVTAEVDQRLFAKPEGITFAKPE